MSIFAEHPRGFTLLELLAVLFIIGLTAALVGPRLPLMRDRFDYALKRESFEQELGGLVYQAYRDNRDLVLSGTFDFHGPVEKSSSDKDAPGIPNAKDLKPVNASGLLVDLPPVAPGIPTLHLPEGWQLVTQEPIYFLANGYCKGGTLELDAGVAHYTYKLRPPQCAPVVE